MENDFEERFFNAIKMETDIDKLKIDVFHLKAILMEVRKVIYEFTGVSIDG